jgi:lipopolysaccharide export system protein LptA
MNRLAAYFALSFLAAVLALGSAHSARAQLSPSSKAPVDVTADQLEVQNPKCLAIWSGDAEALQDTSRLRANVINIYNKALPARPGEQAGQSCGQLDRMEADGQVYYVTPTQVVKGDHAVYAADSKTITVTGDVVVSQGCNVSAGTRLVINTDTGQANMASDVTGRGHAGRVRAVLYQSGTGGGCTTGAPSAPKAPVPPPPRRHGA